MQVYNSVKALVLSTRETSALLPHPSCQKCFGEHGILNKQACLSLSSAPAPSLFLLTVPLWGFPGGSVVKNPLAIQETQVQSLGWEDPLQKEITTYSSILAWKKTLWTEKPGRLQSMGLQRVGHDWATKHRHRQVINPAWHIGLRRCTQKHLSMTSGHTRVTFSKSESWLF